MKGLKRPSMIGELLLSDRPITDTLGMYTVTTLDIPPIFPTLSTGISM